MEKKLYYQLSDGADVSNVVMELSGIVAWIEGDESSGNYDTPELDDREYTITPIYLTEEEYENLHEADI